MVLFVTACVLAGLSLPFRGNRWGGTRETQCWQRDTSKWRIMTHHELCRLQPRQGTHTSVMDINVRKASRVMCAPNKPHSQYGRPRVALWHLLAWVRYGWMFENFVYYLSMKRLRFLSKLGGILKRKCTLRDVHKMCRLLCVCVCVFWSTWYYQPSKLKVLSAFWPLLICLHAFL